MANSTDEILKDMSDNGQYDNRQELNDKTDVDYWMNQTEQEDAAKTDIFEQIGNKATSYVKGKVSQVADTAFDTAKDEVLSTLSETYLGTDITGKDKESASGILGKFKKVAATVTGLTAVSGTFDKVLDSFSDEKDETTKNSDEKATTEPAPAEEPSASTNESQNNTVNLASDSKTLSTLQQKYNQLSVAGIPFKVLSFTGDMFGKLDDAVKANYAQYMPGMLPVGSTEFTDWLNNKSNLAMDPITRANFTHGQPKGKTLPDKEELVQTTDDISAQETVETTVETERLGDAYLTEHETLAQREARLKGNIKEAVTDLKETGRDFVEGFVEGGLTGAVASVAKGIATEKGTEFDELLKKWSSEKEVAEPQYM